MTKEKIVPVAIQTTICIRPLLKRERDDAIVLEAQQQQPPQQYEPSRHLQSVYRKAGGGSSNGGAAVALHPLPPKLNGESMAPSAALILQTLSPTTIQTGHDMEFRFDHVFAANPYQMMNNHTPTTATRTPATPSSSSSMERNLQCQAYHQFGRNMALRAMEDMMLLRSTNKTTSSSQQQQQQGRRQHVDLIVAMGSPEAGKSHMCWGPHTGSKRKTVQDGIVLRIAESLFSQFQRLQAGSSNTHGVLTGTQTCALNISLVLVRQDNYRNKGGGDSSCEIHDLVQLTKNQSRNPLSRVLGKGRQDTSNGQIEMEQDRYTGDFQPLNQSETSCLSLEEVRRTIHTALVSSKTLSTRRRCQTHILIQMTPVILKKPKATARIIKRGGMISVLDMAGVTDVELGNNRHHRTRSDAHTAIIHCLQSIQNNEFVRTVCNSAKEGDKNATPSSYKKVPFPRHKLTMLLQPLFSPTYVTKTKVTLLMAASPGTRHYNETKGLLQELESLSPGTKRIPVTKPAVTGLASYPEDVEVNDTQFKDTYQSHKIDKEIEGENSEDSMFFTPRAHEMPKQHDSSGSYSEEKIPPIQPSLSMTYSDSSGEIDENTQYSRPPPVVPLSDQKRPCSARYLVSPNASAPNEDEVRSFGNTAAYLNLGPGDAEPSTAKSRKESVYSGGDLFREKLKWVVRKTTNNTASGIHHAQEHRDKVQDIRKVPEPSNAFAFSSYNDGYCVPTLDSVASRMDALRGPPRSEGCDIAAINIPSLDATTPYRGTNYSTTAGTVPLSTSSWAGDARTSLKAQFAKLSARTKVSSSWGQK